VDGLPVSLNWCAANEFPADVIAFCDKIKFQVTKFVQ
jgi:hypothetical protein